MIVLAGCSRFERPQVSYASYTEAQRVGALGPGGWIPEFLPASATDIREQHDIDTNELWLSFSFTGEFQFPASCSSTNEPLSMDDRTPQWWKDEVARALSPRRSYVCTEQTQLGDGWAESTCQLIVREFKALYRCGASEQFVAADRREDAAPVERFRHSNFMERT
jgi:hypothetical protein